MCILYERKNDLSSKKEILTLEEIERLCDNFIELGVKKIRLTGGEPLVRKDIIRLINKLYLKLNNTNLEEIVLTTNGTLLSKFAKSLKNNGINRINVSLDTLNEKKYKKITRSGSLKNILNGIDEAQKNKIKIKINTVAIKNFNEDDFVNLIEWSNKRKIDITFIEVMPMNETDLDRYLQFMPLNKVFEKLNMQYNFYKIDKNTGGPSVYYNSNKLDNNIGFITPITNNFCANCNRVRITSTGKLFMCLGQNNYVDFKDMLRKDYSNDSIKEKIISALNIKAEKHDFIIDKDVKPYMKRHMNVTGG